MTFRKQCGAFTIKLSEPSPIWVDIRREDDREDLLGMRRFNSEELRDLKYLVDRAVEECERLEPRAGGHP